MLLSRQLMGQSRQSASQEPPRYLTFLIYQVHL